MSRESWYILVEEWGPCLLALRSLHTSLFTVLAAYYSAVSCSVYLLSQCLTSDVHLLQHRVFPLFYTSADNDDLGWIQILDSPSRYRSAQSLASTIDQKVIGFEPLWRVGWHNANCEFSISRELLRTVSAAIRLPAVEGEHKIHHAFLATLLTSSLTMMKPRYFIMIGFGGTMFLIYINIKSKDSGSLYIRGGNSNPWPLSPVGFASALPSILLRDSVTPDLFPSSLTLYLLDISLVSGSQGSDDIVSSTFHILVSLETWIVDNSPQWSSR